MGSMFGWGGGGGRKKGILDPRIQIFYRSGWKLLKGLIWLEISRNCWKCLEMDKMARKWLEMAENSWEGLEMAEKGWKWLEWLEMA